MSLKDVFTVNFDFVSKFITYLYWFDQLGSDVCTNIKKKTQINPELFNYLFRTLHL